MTITQELSRIESGGASAPAIPSPLTFPTLVSPPATTSSADTTGSAALTDERVCQRCGRDFAVPAGRRFRLCPECQELAYTTKIRRMTELARARAQLKRLQLLERELGGPDRPGEYVYQSVEPGGRIALVRHDKRSHTHTFVLRRECMVCHARQPRCGFAPAFADITLTEKRELPEQIKLLCWDCYGQWEEWCG